MIPLWWMHSRSLVLIPRAREVCSAGKTRFVFFSFLFYLSSMPIRTKRWDEETEPADGLRILVCRYRPRGLRKELETWSLWLPELGPSVELHAAAYGKRGVKIGWEIYRRRYLAEMRAPEAQAAIQELAARLRAGQTLTLLCYSSCLRESRCHRSLLAKLIATAASESH